MTQLPSDLLPFYEQIRQYASRVTGSRDTADDVTQEVFMRYLRSGKSYEGSQLRNYLYQTARNYMIDQLRRKKLYNKITVDDGAQALEYRSLLAPAISPEQNAQRAEMMSLVREKVNQLSPQRREILHLRYDEQMKTKDIADVTGMSCSNVRRILSETIAQLAKQFEVGGTQR